MIPTAHELVYVLSRVIISYNVKAKWGICLFVGITAAHELVYVLFELVLKMIPLW
jgi:hypothetical protein